MLTNFLQPICSRYLYIQDYFAIGAKYLIPSLLSLFLAAFLTWGADEKQYKST